MVLCTAALVAPATPAAAATCRFDPVSHAVFVSVGLESAGIVQQGGLIDVADATGQRDCLDGSGAVAASVTNTDAVHVVSDGNVAIVPASGAFAPGLTPESTGISEIEFDVAFTGPSVLTVNGTSGPDDMIVGAKGVNVNGDDDSDVTFVGAGRVVLSAGAGDDDLSAQGGNGTGSQASLPIELWGGDDDDTMDGGSGADLLVGGRGSDALDGRNGPDTLFGLDTDPLVTDGTDVVDTLDGGRGDDILWGGPGRDLLRGSEGDDVLHAVDGNVDKVNGGKGIDTAFVDVGLDDVSGVELPADIFPAGASGSERGAHRVDHPRIKPATGFSP
jgi:Ca2+-binding RTX toxin-like protein